MTITLPGNQSEDQVIVRSLLKSPTVIAGRVFDGNTDFLSNYLYGLSVPAPSGQVEFEISRLDDLYASQGDSKVIQPGGQYPTLNVAGVPATNGHTDKYGAAYIVTYEAVDRNDVLPMRNGNIKLRNHITRQDATRSLAAIDAAVAEHNQSVAASAVWSTQGAAWNDLGAAQASSDAGVNFNTLILNKQDAWKLATAPDLRDAYRAATRADAQIYGSVFSPLNGFLGLDVLINDFVPAGRAYLVERGAAGFVALEKDFAITVVDQPETDRYLVKGAKRAAPFVNNPGAVQVITGISA